MIDALTASDRRNIAIVSLGTIAAFTFLLWPGDSATSDPVDPVAPVEVEYVAIAASTGG